MKGYYFAIFEYMDAHVHVSKHVQLQGQGQPILPIRLSNQDLVRKKTKYIICPRYFRVLFKNVGHLNTSFFRQSVKNLCKKLSCGAVISRKGSHPFYDILVYCRDDKMIDQVGTQLVGPNWKFGLDKKDKKHEKDEKDDKSDDKNDEKNSESKNGSGSATQNDEMTYTHDKEEKETKENEEEHGNSIGKIGNNYHVVIGGPYDLLPMNEFGDTVKSLKQQTIVDSDMLPNDNPAMSSNASSIAADSKIAFYT